MSEEIVIRRAANEADVRSVAELFDAYRVFYKQRSDVEASFRFLLERWKLGETVLYIASVASEPVGFVHLFPSFASAELQRLWILNDLFVDPAHRSLGIARRLMDRAERHARVVTLASF